MGKNGTKNAKLLSMSPHVAFGSAIIFKLNWSKQILNKYGEYSCDVDDMVDVDLWKRGCLQEFDRYLTFEARSQNRKEDTMVTFDSKEVCDLVIIFDSRKLLMSEEHEDDFHQSVMS